MRKAIAALIGVFILFTGTQAQASGTEYTYVQYVNKGYNRVIAIKCHFSNNWAFLKMGQNSSQLCGGNGWIERTQVDPDMKLHAKNVNTGTLWIYPYGCNCQIGGGTYNVWVEP